MSYHHPLSRRSVLLERCSKFQINYLYIYINLNATPYNIYTPSAPHNKQDSKKESKGAAAAAAAGAQKLTK